jgi:hypothetical protein
MTNNTIDINTLIAAGFANPMQLERLQELAALSTQVTEEQAKAICLQKAIEMTSTARDLMQSWLDGNQNDFNWMPTQQQLKQVYDLLAIASYQFSGEGVSFTGALYNFKDVLMPQGE